MRVLRVDLPAAPSSYAPLRIAGDRWVGCMRGDDLLALDLHDDDLDPRRPALVVPGCTQHAFAAGALLARVGAADVRRYELLGGRWEEAARFALPGSSERLQGFALSPSGSRLAAAHLGRGGTCVTLFDAATGEALFSTPYKLSARPAFDVLDGREVLFLSAPSYMGVLLVDARGGDVLRRFEPTTSWDFCHTDYALTGDASRLVTFGCFWAAPYEVRVYDATPWTRGAPASGGAFPLPLVWSQGEDLGCETVLPGLLTSPGSPLAHCLSIVTAGDLPAEGSEELADLVEGMAPENVALLGAVRSLPAPRGLLVRRVDLASGRVASSSLVPAAGAAEGHVHGLPGHRAAVLGDAAWLVDTARGVVIDERPYDRPAGCFTSAATSDGAVVVVRA